MPKLPPFDPAVGRVYHATPTSKGHGYIRIDALVGEDRVKVTSYHPGSPKIKSRTSVALISSYGSNWMALLGFGDEPTELRSAEGLRLDAIAAAKKVASEEERRAILARAATEYAVDPVTRDTQVERDRKAREAADTVAAKAAAEMVANGLPPSLTELDEQKAKEAAAVILAAAPPSPLETQAALAFVTDPAPAPLPKVTCATPESQALYDDLCALFSSRMRDNLRIGEALIALGLRAVRASRETPVIGEFAPA